MDWSCDLCPRGHYMVRQCERGVPSSIECTPCEGSTYLSRPNHHTACITCFEPNTLVKSRNVSVGCRCRKGFYKRDNICWPNTFCPPGIGVHEGSCKECPLGTFSDEYSHTQHCRPLTNCTSLGLTTLRSGTATSDTVCESRPLLRRRHKARTSSPHLTTESFVPVHETVLASSDDGINEEVSVQGSVANTIAIVSSALIVCLVLLALMIVYYMTRRLCRQHRQNESGSTTKVVESLTLDTDSGVLCKSTTSTLSSRRKSIEKNAGGCRNIIMSANTEFDRPECPVVMPLQTNVRESSSSLGLSDAAPSCYENSVHAFSVDSFHDENSVDSRYNPIDLTEPTLEHSDETDFRDLSLQQTGAGSCQSLASTASMETSASSLAYRSRIQARLAVVYTDVLTKGAMEHLVAGLGQEWKTVAHRLGLSQPEIDHILNANRASLEEQIHEMIQKWQKRRAGHAYIAELYGVLLECQRQDLINQLMSLENKD